MEKSCEVWEPLWNFLWSFENSFNLFWGDSCEFLQECYEFLTSNFGDFHQKFCQVINFYPPQTQQHDSIKPRDKLNDFCSLSANKWKSYFINYGFIFSHLRACSSLLSFIYWLACRNWMLNIHGNFCDDSNKVVKSSLNGETLIAIRFCLLIYSWFKAVCWNEFWGFWIVKS